MLAPSSEFVLKALKNGKLLLEKLSDLRCATYAQ
jgi:hypothetical protein